MRLARVRVVGHAHGMRRLALTLALTLAACSSSDSDPQPKPTTTVGDGDETETESGDGDGEPDASTTEPPLLDVPSEGFTACCFCFDGGWCEMETYPTIEACQAYAEEWGHEWEWHANCHLDNTQTGGINCHGSCINP